MTAPRPPGDIAGRNPLFVTLAAGKIVHRFYPVKHDPIFFDRGDSGRFNAPDGAYGVLYVAKSPAGAFSETFLREPGRTLLAADLLAGKAYVRLRLLQGLKLIKFCGPGLARLGATAEVTHGGLPYDIAQTWSKVLHDHAAKPDGIAYFARHDDEALWYALFDRASKSVEEAARETILDQQWFWSLAEPYGVGLAP